LNAHSKFFFSRHHGVKANWVNKEMRADTAPTDCGSGAEIWAGRLPERSSEAMLGSVESEREDLAGVVNVDSRDMTDGILELFSLTVPKYSLCILE
jgi:hypothetical protein